MVENKINAIAEAGIERTKDRILLVDDSPSDLFIAQAILRKLDEGAFQIETADCVEDARAKIEKGLEPRVIISDLVMPKETGLDFYRWLQENKPGWTDRFVLRTQGSGKPELGQFIKEMSEKGRLVYKAAGDIESERKSIERILGLLLKRD